MEHTRLPAIFAVVALAAAACTSPFGSSADAEISTEGTAVPIADYGVVADPPLPVAAPVTPLSNQAAVADHDGSVVVSIAGGELRFDDANDPVPTVATVDPEAELRAVAADGSQAALLQDLDGSSRITVVDRSSGTPVSAVYELPGLIEPEAFSTDGARLFVIDHQVAKTPGAYRVRPFDLATGQLANIEGPTKIPFDDDMNGVGRRQVWSPDATRLYTLYIRQTHHHHPTTHPTEHEPTESEDRSLTDDHRHGEAGTDGFVHVLDLEDEWAFCLDLPEAFGGGDLASTALAVSPDGRTVAVADVSAGAVTFASTEHLVVTETVPLPTFPLDGELHLGLGEGAAPALFLASGTTGRWFDGAATLDPAISGESAVNEVTFGDRVRGITSAGEEVWVWTSDLSNGPTRVRSPRQ